MSAQDCEEIIILTDVCHRKNSNHYVFKVPLASKSVEWALREVRHNCYLVVKQFSEELKLGESGTMEMVVQTVVRTLKRHTSAIGIKQLVTLWCSFTMEPAINSIGVVSCSWQSQA